MKKTSKAQRKRLWKLYRLTPEEQQEIEKYQNKSPIYKLLMGAHMGTDHDHRTGLIRGRLDFRINRALGIIERFAPNNTPAVLRALADYKEAPPAVLALGKKVYGLLGQAKVKRKMVYGPPK